MGVRTTLLQLLTASILTIGCSDNIHQNNKISKAKAKIDAAVSCINTNVAMTGAMLSPLSNTQFRPTTFDEQKAIEKVPSGMVWIPGGEFSIGAPDHMGKELCDNSIAGDARPVHRVHVNSFFIDATEVTNAEFAAFVKATHYITIAEIKPSKSEFPTAPEENLVVVSVVFTPTVVRDLRDHYQWWSYVPGYNWRQLMQELFAFYRVKEMVAKDPSIASKQLFKAVLENDKGYFEKNGLKALVQLVETTHTSITEDEFETSVKNFFATATYPPKNAPLRQAVYQPHIELLNYLHAKEFNVFICSGGTIEFFGGISQDFYGVPRSQVIGPPFKYKFVDSNRGIIRETGPIEMNNKEEKPVAIQQHIGQRSLFACGNEGVGGRYCDAQIFARQQISLIPNDHQPRRFNT